MANRTEVPEEQAKKKRTARFTKRDVNKLTTFYQEDCVATDRMQEIYEKNCKYKWGLDLLRRLRASLAQEKKEHMFKKYLADKIWSIRKKLRKEKADDAHKARFAKKNKCLPISCIDGFIFCYEILTALHSIVYLLFNYKPISI